MKNEIIMPYYYSLDKRLFLFNPDALIFFSIAPDEALFSIEN